MPAWPDIPGTAKSQVANDCQRSAIKSLGGGASMPSDSRIKPSGMLVRQSSSSLKSECDIEAGCSTSVSTLPRISLIWIKT